MNAVTRIPILLAGLAALAAPVPHGWISVPAAGAAAAAQVPFNPADFDKYAGYYRFGDAGNVAHAYRTGSHYYLQLGGQPPMELFPESPTELFATVVAAQFSF